MEILKCNKCGRYADNLKLEGATCNIRFPNSHYCEGTMEKTEKEIPVEPYLECDRCGRRADLLSLADKTCNFRLPDGKSCKGTLKLA